MADARGVAGTPARADEASRRRPADDHLHLRLDRPAEGRDAHPSQRRLEHRGRRSDPSAGRRRRAAGHSADLPLVRLHDDDVDGADAAAEGHLPLQPAGSPRGGQALPPARRDDHDRHAHVRAIVSAAVRAGGFRQAGRGVHRRREALARGGRRLRAAFRRAAGRGLRRHGAFAGGLAPTCRPAAPRARSTRA